VKPTGQSEALPRHLGERFERLAFRWYGGLASGNIGLADGFRIARRRRTRGVQHHTFGPFMIRMDPDVDLLIERNVRLWLTRCR
jgi:hypothetical protein